MRYGAAVSFGARRTARVARRRCVRPERVTEDAGRIAEARSTSPALPAACAVRRVERVDVQAAGRTRSCGAPVALDGVEAMYRNARRTCSRPKRLCACPPNAQSRSGARAAQARAGPTEYSVELPVGSVRGSVRRIAAVRTASAASVLHRPVRAVGLPCTTRGTCTSWRPVVGAACVAERPARSCGRTSPSLRSSRCGSAPAARSRSAAAR